MKYCILTVAALMVLGAAASVDASYTVDFGDSTVNWVGYSGNNNDSIGVPDFPKLTAGSATLSSTNRLESIVFTYTSKTGVSATTWGLLKPGDLFLDVDLNDGWDYVARHSGTTAAGNWALYSFATEIPLGPASLYEVVKQADWVGFSVRVNHPWSLADSTFDNLGADTGKVVAFDGWDSLAANQTGSSTFDLSALNLKVDKLVLAFTVNCANDVVYENVPLREPTGDTPEVPEPTSLIVWGLLSLTFAGGSWRLAFVRRPTPATKGH
jgi:hypothetical protein